MKRNDISNVVAPIIAFNIDTILFKPKEDTFVNKMKSFFCFDREKYNYLSREIDITSVDTINKVWTKNEVSVYLVTFTDYISEIEEILYREDVSYTKLQKVQGIENLRRKVLYNYYYYFDKDLDIIRRLSVDNAKDFYLIYAMLKV